MAEEDDGDLTLAKDLLECFFRSGVERGAIEVADRSAGAIVDGFFDNMQKAVDQSENGDLEFQTTTDHLDSLLKRARIEAIEEREEIAITLYATWLEHFVNWVLICGL